MNGRDKNMKQAKQIYDDLWNLSIALFQQNRCETDPLIADPNDRRRGLTLRIRPNADIVAKIVAFTDKLRTVAPNQYYPPASDLHLTALTIVSCRDGFSCDEDMGKAYAEAIAECIEDLPHPHIAFKGITASPSCLLVQGLPQNDSLTLLRERLRSKFKDSPLPNTIDSRYPARAAHVTIMRFQESQDDLGRFVQFITENRDHPFGTQKVEGLGLVHNDWYHKKANTRLISTFTLNYP